MTPIDLKSCLKSKTGISVKGLEKVASLVGASAISLKAELALFISLFKHVSKTLRDDFDIQAIESIVEEADEERIGDIEPKADEVM